MDTLQLYAVSQLPDGTIYQKAGTPPHFANVVHSFLDEQLPARWIGKRSPYIVWPARTSDLTPPDFLLWMFVKDHVYWTPECVLLSTMYRHKCRLTHGSRLNTGWTSTNEIHVEVYGI